MMEAELETLEIAKNNGFGLKGIANVAFSLSGVALVGAAILAATNVQAQTVPSYANEFTQAYGSSSYQMMTPYDAGTRDLNANRVVVDGVIVYGDNIAQSLANKALGIDGTSFSGTGYAIGNQLNINTNGSFNTVVVDSTQINNGNQTVIINSNVNTNSASTNSASTNSSGILNGGLNF